MNDNKPPIDWADRLVGLGAGMSSALLFAASTRGTGLAMSLAYVCVLPLLIGGLGFSVLTAAIGAAAGAGVLAYAGDPLLGAAFFLVFGLPGLLLGLFARWNVPRGTPGGLPPEVAPLRLSPGALLAGAAALAVFAAWGLTAFAAWDLAGAPIWSEGGFAAALDAALRQYGPTIDATLGKFADVAPELDLGLAKTIVVLSFPAAMAASQTLLLAFNLWLAARAVEISGRLDRDWPPLPETVVLPRALGVAFVAAIGLCFVSPPVAVFAGAFTAASGVALALQGLACAHALTRGHSSRSSILAALYAVVAVGLVIAPPILTLLSLLGLAESAFDLRARKARAQTPVKTAETNETGDEDGSDSA
jgi:hypothetical protein